MAYLCDPRIACADQPGEVEATRLVTDLTNGDTTALCDQDWQLMVMAMASAWESQAAEAQATDDQGDESDEDEDQDQAAVTRLEQATPPAEPDPNVSQVVKRGTSPSRRAHEAKKRRPGRDPERAAAAAQALAEAQAAAEVAAGTLGQPDE